MSGVAGRHVREWVLLAALLLGLLVAAVRGQWLERVDYWFYDSSVAWSGQPAADDILILAIDETSLARYGRWPWSRQLLADVLERLAAAGTGPVLLDVILSEPERGDPGADTRLAAAIARHGRVVLPVFMPGAGSTAVLPMPQFAAHARLGHAQALVDGDGVSRRYLPVEGADGADYAHVAMVLRDLSLGHATTLPMPVSGPVLVPFAGPAGHFERQPVAALLDGHIPPAALRGKVVLVGATATGLGDNLVTPLASTNGAMPGVEFVANVLQGLRAGPMPQMLAPDARLAISVALALALLVALLPSSPRMALVLSACAGVGAVLAAWAALAVGGRWGPPAAPLVVVALAYPLWSWRRLEASLDAMARETARIAALVRPGVDRVVAPVATGLFDPVETRITAITRAVDRIADAMAADTGTPEGQQYREDMMRHLAHDLRSPLVSLRSLADQLRAGAAGANTEMLARIDDCARRSLELSEQFLLMGRAQALEPAGFPEVDLVQVLHQSADDLWEDARRAGARIERRCTLDTAPVRGDGRLLQRALLNLGWNALRHGPPGGVVTLSLDAVPDGYILAVHDQGGGFEAQAMPELTRRYAQGPGAAGGHGLGLALVQLVAQKHNAALQAARPPGGGFTVSLQLARAVAPQSSHPPWP